MSAWAALGSFAGLARNRIFAATAAQPPPLAPLPFLAPAAAAAAATRWFSKYVSKAARKRLVLTTKRAHKGFYKGNRGTKEGRLTSKGRFVVDPLKRMQIVAPDLDGFKLKPYIAASASRFPPDGRL